MYFDVKNQTSHESAKSLEGGFANIMHGAMTRFVRCMFYSKIDLDILMAQTQISGRSEYLFKQIVPLGVFEKIKILIIKILNNGDSQNNLNIKAYGEMLEAS